MNEREILEREIGRLTREESAAYHAMSERRSEYEFALRVYGRIADRLNDLKIEQDALARGRNQVEG